MKKQILVPIDRSTQSHRALEYTLEEYPEAEITALHVVTPSTYWHGDSDGSVYIEEISDQLEETGREILETARQTASESGKEIKTDLQIGPPARLINEYATTHDIDHIVMGSHGRDGISRILLGSVAETVTRRAPVPVTIIR